MVCGKERAEGLCGCVGFEVWVNGFWVRDEKGWRGGGRVGSLVRL
jgi:hypothetical protein